MKKVKGFTLLELIVVMAIFSMIAVGALAIVQPAMRLFTSTSQQEEINACTDNMKRYIEDNLRYANRLYYCEGYDDYRSIMYNEEYNYFDVQKKDVHISEYFKDRYFPCDLNTTVYVMEIDGGTQINPVGSIKIYKIVDFTKGELEEVSTLNSQFYDSYLYNIDISLTSPPASETDEEESQSDTDFYFNINVFDKDNNDLGYDLPTYDVSFYVNMLNLSKSVIVNNGEDKLPTEDTAIDIYQNTSSVDTPKYYFIYTVPEIIIP